MNQVLQVFGKGEKLSLDREVEALIEERIQARSRRDFQRADAIRKELDDRGIVRAISASTSSMETTSAQ